MKQLTISLSVEIETENQEFHRLSYCLINPWKQTCLLLNKSKFSLYDQPVKNQYWDIALKQVTVKINKFNLTHDLWLFLTLIVYMVYTYRGFF